MEILSKTKDCELLKIGERKKSPSSSSSGEKLIFFVIEMFPRGVRTSIIIIISSLNKHKSHYHDMNDNHHHHHHGGSEGDFTIISRNVSWKAPDVPSKVFSSHSNILSDWIGCNKKRLEVDLRCSIC